MILQYACNQASVLIKGVPSLIGARKCDRGRERQREKVGKQWRQRERDRVNKGEIEKDGDDQGR